MFDFDQKHQTARNHAFQYGPGGFSVACFARYGTVSQIYLAEFK